MGATYAGAVRGALRGYKLLVSPLVGPSCRFLPSCSEYAAAVLVSQGPVRGGALALRRLCRCRPGGGSGYDPAPPAPAGPGPRVFTCEP